MDRSYWLVNKIDQESKGLQDTNNKDQFLKYMFFDSGKVTFTLGKEPTVMTPREKLKKEAAKEDWTKKESQDC